ncbi:hypothetical protein GGP76_003175 [Salinibacter ruber]|nr:hypothetical protein [Salinibacter ruber]
MTVISHEVITYIYHYKSSVPAVTSTTASLCFWNHSTW